MCFIFALRMTLLINDLFLITLLRLNIKKDFKNISSRLSFMFIINAKESVSPDSTHCLIYQIVRMWHNVKIKRKKS
jgi:hypothetical protein